MTRLRPAPSIPTPATEQPPLPDAPAKLNRRQRRKRAAAAAPPEPAAPAVERVPNLQELYNREVESAREPVPEAQRTAALAEDGETILRHPVSEPGSWVDPSDDRAQVSGYRRSSSLRLIRARGTPLDDRHVIAGDLYELDWENAQRGGFPSGPPPEVRGRSGPGDYTALVFSGRSFEKATEHVGRMAAKLLAHVLFERRDVASWAEFQRIDGKPLHPKFAMGILFSALDRLAEHYVGRIDQVLRNAAAQVREADRAKRGQTQRRQIRAARPQVVVS